ncbi:response regulator [Spirosoma fluminis]
MPTNKVIYIVDDSTDYLFLLQQLFTRFITQYSVRFFASGEALYDCLRTESERPAFIIMDLNMPAGLSGYDTLVRLKQQTDWKQVPVVMMSNMVSDYDLKLCYQAGASSFLRKPVGMIAMQAIMGSVCHFWVDLNILPPMDIETP